MRTAFLPLQLLFCLLFFSPPPALSAPSSQAKGNEHFGAAQKRSLDLNERGAAAAQAGDLAQAESLFQEALHSDKKNLSAAFNLASIYIQQDKASQAVHLLADYTKDYPKDAGLFSRLADAYFAEQKLVEAKENYEKAYGLDPELPKLPAKLANLYTIEQNFPKAIELYLQAVEQDPKNGSYLANLSSLFLANGDAQKAISTAKRGLQVLPTSGLYVTLGSAYEQLKDYKN
ncbi:MAG: tetratricopeptide repeat protein, partial [Bdellovibrionales bacterium]|nr:tetratricopeptide repeat protein [Bdellovibrionales bacterium]